MNEDVHRTHEQLEEWLERSGRALEQEIDSDSVSDPQPLPG